MDRSTRPVEESDPLITALEVSPGRDLLPVTNDGQLTGLIDRLHVLDILRARTTIPFGPDLIPQQPRTAMLVRPSVTVSAGTGNPE